MDLHQVEKALNIWGFPEHPVAVQILGVTMDFNVKTIVMTWLVMALLILFSWAATRNLSLREPKRLQVVFEMLYEGIRDLVRANMDPVKGAPLVNIVVTLFLFILFSNLIGLFPSMMSPTADYNTTFGLAVTVIILVQYFGIRYKGTGGYLKHFVQPFVLFLPINIVEELAKPITLAFRLYGNIFAGEVLVAVLLGMIPITADLLGGFLASIIWLGFSVFVGFIQAFIFTMLTIAYVSMAVGSEH
ncbi:MAG: F0F1 ATP synthase subunit A [Desulfotomaculaceae bacterium]